MMFPIDHIIRGVMYIVKNIFLSIGLIILILGWLIALPFIMLYDKLFGGWKKNDEIDILGPLGNTWCDYKKKYPVLIGGGVGCKMVVLS